MRKENSLKHNLINNLVYRFKIKIYGLIIMVNFSDISEDVLKHIILPWRRQICYYDKRENDSKKVLIDIYRRKGYDKKNLIYGLFLHKYPINIVYNLLSNAEDDYDFDCDCINDKEGGSITINEFKDIFDLIDCEYVDYDNVKIKEGNLFNSVAEMFRNGFNRVKNLIVSPNRLNAPPYYRSFLENYGNILIKEIIVCKTPI
jgi:hypothetical protein